MSPEQKRDWVEAANNSISQQEEVIRSKESDYTKTESAMTSHHDHLRQDLADEINSLQAMLVSERGFLHELESADFRYKVESGAFVDLIINGEPKQFLFMNNRGQLPDIKVVIPESPLGSSIVSKIAGDKTSYLVDNKTYIVEVKSVL